jgi:hypothetical protein
MPKRAQPAVVTASAAALKLDEAREHITVVDEEEFIEERHWSRFWPQVAS